MQSERPFESGTATDLTDRTAASYDERLNRILGVATQIIAEVGYERASMRSVARAAGCSLAGLYHYFPNKERMLFLIQHRTFNALLNNLREKLLGVDDPLEQFHIMVRTHLSYFVANMPALKVCSHELDSLSGASYEETRRIRREYYAVVRAIIDRLVDAHAPTSALDRHVAAMSLFGMLNWLYRWYDPKRSRVPSVVASQFATQFLHGLLGAAMTTAEPAPAAPG